MTKSIFLSTRQVLLGTLALVMLLSISSLAQAQSYPPAWSANATYATGDLVQLSGNTFKAIQPVTTPGANPTSNYHYWQLNQVQSNTTLMIGAGETFPTINIAWTYAWNAKVADGVYLHFYISTVNGNYAEFFPTPFFLDHASGARIAILGDHYLDISLNFGGTNGFIIDTGHSINTISGTTLTNVSNSPVGIKADGNATISALSGVYITGFGTCIQSTQNSTMSVIAS
jgi:hypothetical protein